MGATLSKLWSTIRNAWTGGATTGKNTQQHQQVKDQTKDIESGINTPTQATEPVVNMSGVKKYEITEPWLKLNCSLGEGPFWEEETNTIRFLDVEKCKVHRVNVDEGPSSHKVIKDYSGVSMGCTADIEGNDKEFIFAGKYGYGIANKESGDYRWIKKVWSEDEVTANKHEKFRGNDGAVDSQGRFWAGYMFDPLVSEWSSEGAVFRLNPDMSLDRPLSNITIPNGTTWNKKDTTMYFADSPFKTIYQFDYDPATGAVTNKRPFFVMPEDNRYGKDAVPDGHCIDEEGYMWTALHGGSHVLRISPKGEIVAEIKVPTAQPTCPCFVGEELFITSAGGTSGPDGSPADEFAGSCFKINVGVRGLKRFKFKGGEQVEGGKVNGHVVGE
ncbi:SGL-domain-containing protein [Cucurbitaria berberidis CBS 394.84]|uniref:SGL-domain-containing protein n=1 Tax=Cucurbitaria berberidis CBS 394.84 TaxID=1168544 RepID=A0A9P4GAY2_9PLEO|nr:SGL-domain-containing protein [Cucurbitaria berberidis CBS 394.84]KAF1842250.1 SGL-domain-containing protein [Cucurbitaria berberidis CBS 394.84]